jgi:hypothetical protein
MITPLQIDQLTRDTYGDFDAVAIAQLMPLAYDSCYKPRLYKAPDSSQETLAAGGYTSYGLSISPGSLIYGFYNAADDPAVVQITDTSLDLQMFSEPVPVGLISNNQKTVGYPCLLCGPYPVVGTGLFLVEIWNNSDETARIQIVIGVLEALDEAASPMPIVGLPFQGGTTFPQSGGIPMPSGPSGSVPAPIPPATGLRPPDTGLPIKGWFGYPGSSKK